MFLCSLVAGPVVGADPARRVPTVDDLLSLKSLSTARISPDGKWVAYGVTHSDFKEDAFVTQLWLADIASGKTRQLTRVDDKSAESNPIWSPDGQWLAFTSDRTGDKSPDLRHFTGGRGGRATDQERVRGSTSSSGRRTGKPSPSRPPSQIRTRSRTAKNTSATSSWSARSTTTSTSGPSRSPTPSRRRPPERLAPRGRSSASAASPGRQTLRKSPSAPPSIPISFRERPRTSTF